MLDKLGLDINVPTLLSSAWVFFVGSVVALLRSLVDGTRRTLTRLLLAVVFGGIGGWLAADTFDGQWWAIAIGAIMCENLAVGLFNLSRQFRDDPMAIIERAWAIVGPFFKR